MVRFRQDQICRHSMVHARLGNDDHCFQSIRQSIISRRWKCTGNIVNIISDKENREPCVRMGESIQGSDRKASSDAHGVAMLSCELCTKRKIRCDKKQPCTACVKAGKECSPVVRARLPRGRRGGRKEANTELRNRVRRLEDLVLSLSGNPAGDPSPNSDFSSLAIDESKTDASLDRPLQDTPAFPPKNVPDGQYSPSNDRDISRLLGSSVWAQLSNEVRSRIAILVKTYSFCAFLSSRNHDIRGNDRARLHVNTA